jgi:hypothetical protein
VQKLARLLNYFNRLNMRQKKKALCVCVCVEGMGVCVYACACVHAREREREGDWPQTACFKNKILPLCYMRNIHSMFLALDVQICLLSLQCVIATFLRFRNVLLGTCSICHWAFSSYFQ